MNKKKIFALVLIVALMLTGCGNVATLKNGEEVVAKLKGKSITAEDLYDELKKQGGAVTLTNMIDAFVVNKEIKTDDDAESYADSQLSSYKQSYKSYGQDFNAALTAAGYTDENDFKDELILEYKKNIVTENYVKDELSDSEIQKYYDENIYGDIEARHILISPNTKDDMTDEEKTEAEKKAKKEAEDIIKKLDKGEKFEDLAKKYSDDEGTASEGGKLTVTYGSVVDEFWEGANELKDGEYSKKPVKSEYGYHIILKVDQKDKPKLKEVKDDIKSTLANAKLDSDSKLHYQTLIDIRKDNNIKWNDDELEKQYNDLMDQLLQAATSNSNN